MAFGGKAVGCRDFCCLAASIVSNHSFAPTGLPRLEPASRSAVQPQPFVKHIRLLDRTCRRGSPGM